MSNQPEFDVFLAHNSQDKPEVRAIAQELKRCGLKPWLDEEQIPPGRPFQDLIQKAIQSVKSAAIFIGPQGLGKWQIMELRSLIGKLVEADIPVIPVLLPGVDGIPDDLDFLKQLNWVSFTNGIDDTQALENLKWGITQARHITEVQADDLSSENGVDYTHRRNLPEAGKLEPNKVRVIQKLNNLIATSNTTIRFLLSLVFLLSLIFLLPNAIDYFSSLIPDNVIRIPDDLSSEKAIDYTQLRKLLKSGQWEKADQETLAVMLKASGTEAQGVATFPCTDLRTIDKLWEKYSNGRFGFSVQKRIWESVGGNLDADFDLETFRKFGDRVGWKVQGVGIDYPDDVIFSTSAPEGHLPTTPTFTGEHLQHVDTQSLRTFSSRVETCKV